jgi:hypothetical protein
VCKSRSPACAPGPVVLGVVGSFQRMGFARVPLAPVCGKDLSAHLCVQKDDFGIGAPRSPKPDVGSARRSCQRAVQAAQVLSSTYLLDDPCISRLPC